MNQAPIPFARYNLFVLCSMKVTSLSFLSLICSSLVDMLYAQFIGVASQRLLERFPFCR